MNILRYWGSHLKSLRQASLVAAEFCPMIERGWDCHLVLEREPADLGWLKEFTSLGVTIHYEPRPKRNLDIGCISRVVSLMRRIRPDVFMCENIHLSPIIGATLTGVAVKIWKKHAMNSSFESGAQLNFRHRLSLSTRITCDLATIVLAVSGAVRNELVDLGVPSGKIMIRPNARPVLVDRPYGSREQVLGNFDLAADSVVWISVARAVPVKGWEMLVRAFRRVVEADPRAKLLLVGGIDRPDELATAAKLRHEIECLELDGHVKLAGQVDDPTSLLRVCDGFIMSSHSEGFSVAVIEALVAGLPCVATRVGVAPDVIQDGVNGMLVDRFDERALADVLIKVTCDDSLRARLAANADVPLVIPTLEDFTRILADDCAALWKARGSDM